MSREQLKNFYVCLKCAWYNVRDEHSKFPLDLCLNCGHDRSRPLNEEEAQYALSLL